MQNINTVTLYMYSLLIAHQSTLSFFWVWKLDSGKLWVRLHLFHHRYELWKIEHLKCSYNSLSPHSMHGRKCELQISTAIL